MMEEETTPCTTLCKPIPLLIQQILNHDYDEEYVKSPTGTKECQFVHEGNLPIHICLHQKSTSSTPPLSYIQTLIQTNPTSIKIRGVGGMLPLHIAVKHEFSTPTITYLISQYPIALSVKSFEWKTPRDYNNSEVVLHRPKVCWKDEKHRIEHLHWMDDSMNLMEERVMDISRLDQCQLYKLEDLTLRCETLEPILNEAIMAQEESMKRFQRDVLLLDQIMQEFVQESNDKMDVIQSLIQDYTDVHYQEEDESMLLQVQWNNDLMNIQKDIQRLSGETKECEQIASVIEESFTTGRWKYY